MVFLYNIIDPVKNYYWKTVICSCVQWIHIVSFRMKHVQFSKMSWILIMAHSDRRLIAWPYELLVWLMSYQCRGNLFNFSLSVRTKSTGVSSLTTSWIFCFVSPLYKWSDLQNCLNFVMCPFSEQLTFSKKYFLLQWAWSMFNSSSFVKLFLTWHSPTTQEIFSKLQKEMFTRSAEVFKLMSSLLFTKTWFKIFLK